MNPELRIGGLASGFDVSGTINKILEIESRRVERAQEQQDKLNEQIGAWIDVKDGLADLNRTSDELRWLDVWRTMSTTSSNPMALDATANATADNATYSIEVLQLARAQTLASTSGLATSNDPLTSVAGIQVGDEFEIGGQTFTITAEDTLATLRDKINAAAENMPDDQRVTASILDNRLTLQRQETGDQAITLTDTVGSTLSALGFFDPANELLSAQNAVFTVNNALVERSSNTGLDDIIQGVSLNLRGEGFSELTVGRDNEVIKQAIREFIDAYNIAAEVNEFHGGFDETDPTNPIPGVLQGDGLIREISTKLRRQATELMSTSHTAENSSYQYNGQAGVMSALQDLGIWTVSEMNRLEIVDEARLDDMLERYPDEVEQLFRGVQTEDGRAGGIAKNIFEYTRNLTDALEGTIDLRIQRIDEDVIRQDERIEGIIKDIELKERLLWRDFGAMDSAIGSMNKDLEWLLNSLGLN
jgi:flagellar hook-associated protein 2